MQVDTSKVSESSTGRREKQQAEMPLSPRPPAGAATLEEMDLGEAHLIDDFGPSGRIHSSQHHNTAVRGARYTAAPVAELSSSPRSVDIRSTALEQHQHDDAHRVATDYLGSTSPIDPGVSSITDLIDKVVPDDRNLLRRRIVYNPTELARALQPPCLRVNRHRALDATAIPYTDRRLRSAYLHEQIAVLVERLNEVLEMAVDPSRPGRESLLICKAVTDALLVNAPQIRRDIGSDDLACALRAAWRHAIEHWNGDSDEPHSAADLHLTASWFQAWCASDDTAGEGEPTIDLYGFQGMLPGDWAWVLDHLEIAGASEGIHLDEVVELDADEDRRKNLRNESWGLEEIKQALLSVSDEEWFQEGGVMLDLKLMGPGRASTFRRVFSRVPGAIYSCLKDRAGVESTPPTFRMYTTGDIFEALGEKVMLRCRDGGGEGLMEEGTALSAARSPPPPPPPAVDGRCGNNSPTKATQGRQIVSLVEFQVAWVGGHTHLLGWLDFMQV